ncbi:MAG TPA: alkaline phosphatase family protein, partial [Polyangiales bacterium]|nr:alkaline phosphatase family protein [Polyangiales bacterium]
EISAAKKKGLLCIQPDDWENGCEDLALLPEVMNFVERHERAFVYQEFIWGHDILYNDRSGRSNAAYYSSYVDQLLKELRARNLQDETLLVVTSDHGFRDQGLQDELWVYQIPLWFYAPRFESRAYDQLLSHLDFRELLLAELDPSSSVKPAHHPLVMIVGPTRSNMVATIGEQGSFLLFKERFGRQFLLAQRGGDELSGDELVYAFESYRALFPKRLQKRR